MIQSTFALSVCGLILTGAAIAATPEPTAAQDAQAGEVAKQEAPAVSNPASDSAAQAGAVTPEATGAEASAQASTQAAANYSDAELKNFVDAAKGVDQVKLKYEGKLSSTKNPAETEKIKKEADAELSKTVEAKGITVEQYNKIHQAAMQDPQLLSRIQKHM